MRLNSLIKRIINISYKNKLSHIGSCITSVEIIHNILKNKKEKDIFILSEGHAGLAYYVVLEKLYGIDAEMLLEKHGVHPNRDPSNYIQVSTGSLGSGITIGVGMALANKKRTIHCLLSDGECAEGSVWESLRFIMERNISNIKIYVNMNGYSAYEEINKKYLEKILRVFLPSIIIKKTSFKNIPFLKGLDAHYHVITDKEYASL